MTHADERRRQERLMIRLPIDLEIRVGIRSEQHKGDILNISEEGLFLASEGPVKPDMKFECQFVWNGESCTARGQVQWGSERGGGIKLEEASDSYRSFVHRLASADIDERSAVVATVSGASGRLT